MNFIYSFIIFEAGAFFGFFVAALLNAARAGQEITIYPLRVVLREYRHRFGGLREVHPHPVPAGWL